MSKKAFTLMEVLAVVVILGVLSGLTVSRFFKASEMQRAATAINHMRIIQAGVQINMANRTVPDCDPCDSVLIKQYFEVAINDPDFAYQVFSSPGSAVWTVNAVRQASVKNYTLSIAHTDPGAVLCSGADCGFINR
jgi:prepilin-type N-terminal cleavage/methylation domain-containing protein